MQTEKIQSAKKDFIGASQKSGVATALDPERNVAGAVDFVDSATVPTATDPGLRFGFPNPLAENMELACWKFKSSKKRSS